MLEILGSALPQLVDRLIALLREGKRERRELLEHHVEPIFRLLKEVIDDYSLIFSELERDFLDDAIPPSRTVQRIFARRHTTLPLRHEILQYAASIHEQINDLEVKDFALACRAVLRRDPAFFGPPIVGGGVRSGLSGMLDEIFEAVRHHHAPSGYIEIIDDPVAKERNADAASKIDATPREIFVWVVRANRNEAESRWSHASGLYYRLRLRLLR